MLTKGAAAARLLIVDDNEFNTDFLTRRLQRQGYNVTNVKDGKSALDLVRRGEVDIMLLDIEMPVLSGFGLRADAKDLLREVGWWNKLNGSSIGASWIMLSNRRYHQTVGGPSQSQRSGLSRSGQVFSFFYFF